MKMVLLAKKTNIYCLYRLKIYYYLMVEITVFNPPEELRLEHQRRHTFTYLLSNIYVRWQFLRNGDGTIACSATLLVEQCILEAAH